MLLRVLLIRDTSLLAACQPGLCFRYHLQELPGIKYGSHVNLPAQAQPSYVHAQQLEPFKAQRPHGKPTKPASGLLWLGLGLGFRVEVMVAVSRSLTQNHLQGKNSRYSLVQKPISMQQHHFLRARNVYRACEGGSTSRDKCQFIARLHTSYNIRRYEYANIPGIL